MEVGWEGAEGGKGCWREVRRGEGALRVDEKGCVEDLKHGNAD